jgi:hypothetical protein
MTCCCPQREAHPCVHYVHNPKAGSTFLASHEGLPRWLSADPGYNRTCWSCSKVANLASSRPNHTVDWPPRRDLAFTVVRDPIDTAVAAYIEVQRRPLLSPGMPRWDGFDTAMMPHWPPRYLRMPCADRTQRTARFEAYIDTLLRGEPIGREAHHVWPQALKVNYVTRRGQPRYDAILRIEELYQGVRELSALFEISIPDAVLQGPSSEKAHSTRAGSVASHLGPLAERRHVRNSTHQFLWESDPDFKDCSDIDLNSTRLLRKMCRLYASDYTCFGFALPELCVRAHAP